MNVPDQGSLDLAGGSVDGDRILDWSWRPPTICFTYSSERSVAGPSVPAVWKSLTALPLGVGLGQNNGGPERSRSAAYFGPT